MQSRVLVLLLLFGCCGCRSSITPTRLREVSPGLPGADVVRRFGEPNRIEETETTGLHAAIYHYSSAQGDARVILVNDHVFGTEYVPTPANSASSPPRS